MIMQQTLFIVILAVVIALALAYRWKKKAENIIGNDLNALIDADDWRGVCRILSKQLIIWGVLLVLCIALFDKAKFSVWKSSVLSYNPVDGQTFLCNRFEAVKEEWNDEEDWNVKVVGNDENLPPIDDFGISDESYVYLVEVPVKEPWKVFAYIPMGEWNECPTAVEHMGYCDDTIFQGENLTSLAAELKKSTVWCFWWD